MDESSEKPEIDAANSPEKKTKKRYTITGMLLLLIFAGFVAYVGLIGVLLHSDFFDDIVLRPFPPKEHAYADPMTPDLRIKGVDHYFKAVDGSVLHGWYFKKPGATRVVLFHHGNAGNINYRLCAADCLLRNDVSVFLYDYRQYGKSTGKKTVAGLVPDGLAAYDYLTGQLGVDPQWIVNYGESIGTGVATSISTQRPSCGLILQSAIGSLPMMGHQHMNFVKGVPLLVLVPDVFFPDPRFNNVEQIKDVHVPLLMVHGLSDNIAPYHHSELVFANANQPKTLVALPGCGHNDISGGSKEYVQALADFFKSIPANGNSSVSANRKS